MKMTDRIKKASLIQHDSTDCGAACLASVIRYFGGHSSIENIRKLSGTSQSGTTMLGLYQAAREYGMDATGYEATIQDIIDYKGVMVLHIKSDSGQEHFIVNYGYCEGKFYVWDPAKGLVLMAIDELDEIWESKKCLGLIPNGSFLYEKEHKKNGRTWLKDIIRPDSTLLLISVVLGIALSILSLVMAVFSQKLIDSILPSKDLKLLLISIFLVFILLVARIILGAVRQQILLFQGKSFNIRIVDNFFGKLMFLPKSFFDTRKTGDFVGRLNDTIRIQRVITEFVSVYIIDLLILITSLVALVFYSQVSAFLTLLVIPVLFISIYRWNKRIISSQHEVMSRYAQSQSNYIDSIQGISVIKSLGWQDDYKEKNKTVFSEFQEKAFLLGKIKVRLGLLTGIIGTNYLILVLLYVSIKVINELMTAGELLAVLSISSTILPSILNLALIAIPVSEARVAIKRMFEFSQIEPEDNISVGAGTIPPIHQIRLENISFRFPGQKLLIDDITMTLERGKIVSLVGESGCGKSTLANILLRFYLPEAGKIILNHQTDAEEINLEKWRSSVGIIPQEIHIFNGTILQNLITELSESKLKELITLISGYGLIEFIDSLPSGLMTMAGEEGINLSGGQKQLIGLIRALINKPEILIIDEGTSNMDRVAEGMIMELISALKHEMGILMISHRVNIIKHLSDVIYVMENRTISAQGTHDELVRYDNLYKRFWDEFY
jgi:ABC-type bacteriocin/lantibiotic exporter with double-glycine peptidase domain